MPIEDFIIHVYCMIEEVMPQHFSNVALRSRGAHQGSATVRQSPWRLSVNF